MTTPPWCREKVMVYCCTMIIYHDFLPPPRRGSHVKSDNRHTQSSRYTPQPIYLTSEPRFSVVAPFLAQLLACSLAQHRAKQKWPLETHSVTYVPGLSTLSAFASTVIPLLPKTTFTPSIQPNLGLPRTRPPLTSAINTLDRKSVV